MARKGSVKNSPLVMLLGLAMGIAVNVSKAQDAEAYYLSNVDTIVRRSVGLATSPGGESYTP